MDLVNERDTNGIITKAAPTFDYIENKAIEEEHRKGQLSKQLTEAQALLALAVIRGPGDKKVIPSSDGTVCRIEIDNVLLSEALSRGLWVLQQESQTEGSEERRKESQVKARQFTYRRTQAVETAALLG